ncbi:hypothetical protein WJR50_32850 [Catalinimonas sp. 4WD22]|uniref:hypothetical protein n=1 Tax=Catalinimonas locisalis TaxID=3133978 RepID=UPI003100DAEF
MVNFSDIIKTVNDSVYRDIKTKNLIIISKEKARETIKVINKYGGNRDFVPSNETVNVKTALLKTQVNNSEPSFYDIPIKEMKPVTN